MRPITLHPASVLAGLGLAALLVLVSGAAQSVGSTRPVPVEQQIIGHIPASWWTFIELHSAADGTPIDAYTIPSNRHLVVTRCVANSSVSVDGQPSPGLDGLTHFSWANSIPELNGTRVPLQPGALLTAGPFWTDSSASIWGYLEPVH